MRDMTHVIRLTLLSLLYLGLVRGEAFSSTANLVSLVQSEKELIHSLEAYIADEENRLAEIKGYIEEIKGKNESNEDLFYAGHPVNAYNLIKRWYRLSSMTPNTANYEAIYNKLSSLDLPSHSDFLGASAAIIRLQRTFSLEVDDIAKGYIKNKGGAKQLEADDFVHIGRIALSNHDYGLACQWLEKAVSEPKGNIPNSETFTDLSEAYKGIGAIGKAVEYARRAWEAEPSRNDLDLHYQSLKILQDESPLTDPPDTSHDAITWKRDLPSWKENYEKLCRGEADATSDPKYAKTLICRYKPGTIPYVVYKEEILSWNPRISMFYDVISNDEAEMIKEKAYPLLYRAEVVGDEEELEEDRVISSERISKVAWLWDEDKDIHRLSLRVKDITGLETEYRNPFSSSEPFQVVNYGIGGQYEPHVDFYENAEQLSSVPDYIQGTGDRLATFLFYLTDVEHGGATVFPRVKIRVSPKKNAAAFWYNCKLSGEFDSQTEHAGCPVLLGQKWVSNKWIREFGQEFRRQCALSAEAIDKS